MAFLVEKNVLKQQKFDFKISIDFTFSKLLFHIVSWKLPQNTEKDLKTALLKSNMSSIACYTRYTLIVFRISRVFSQNTGQNMKLSLKTHYTLFANNDEKGQTDEICVKYE